MTRHEKITLLLGLGGAAVVVLGALLGVWRVMMVGWFFASMGVVSVVLE